MKKAITVFLVLALLAAAAAGGWVLYDRNVDRSGWVQESGGICYRDFHGDNVTDWQKLDGATYYFGEDGILATGWQTLDAATYYFGKDGVLRTGWQDIDGQRYCMDPDGVLLTQWQELDGQRYYFGTDGKMAVNWQEIDGVRHCFSESGVLQTGWLDMDGMRFFLNENGSPLTGQQQIEGQIYHFGEDGSMTTGWAAGAYYLQDGTLASGWQDVDGRRYFFTESGVPYTGWKQEGEYSYYFLEDGAMAVGPNEIDGKSHYFSPRGIHIWLVNPWNEIPEDYEVELLQSEGGFRIARVCFDSFTQMMADMRAAGLNPELASGYRSYWDQYAMYMDAVNKYGAEKGSQIAARPNTSEHHLGLAVDILVPGSNVSDKTAEKSAVQQWLMEHCWDYGFILRYPEGTTEITGIIYEPWHYRYVGLEVSQELKTLGITLEEYLGAYPVE